MGIVVTPISVPLGAAAWKADSRLEPPWMVHQAIVSVTEWLFCVWLLVFPQDVAEYTRIRTMKAPVKMPVKRVFFFKIFCSCL